MMIQRYFASLGIEVDKSSVKKVDKTLDQLENRLRKLGTFANKPIVLDIGNFNVDQKKLNIALGTALDIASSRLIFEVSHFVVNQAALNRTVSSALNRASSTQSMVINQRERASSVGRATTGAALGGGLIGRGISGLYGPAIGLALGGYGLSSLNQRNQQVVSAQLQSNAVVQQAGGTVEQGQQSFQWLRAQGDRIGFNYLDASSDYNKLLSGLTGAGMSVQQGQQVFKGFSELSRVNKLDRVQQQRVYRALSQIAGKNKLQSEELTGQLAESLPGAVSIFAQAYQNQLAATGKGGGKTGQEAITELLAAMKKGNVKGSILNYAGDVASQRAAPGLQAASQASQAEQARYQNSLNDMAVIASGSGVEEGFARIFRTLNGGLSESGDLVRTLAEGFNEATKWADDLLLFPQSFVRALEGRDSLVADWLGVDRTKDLVEDWKQIKDLWKEITDIKPEDTFGNFLPTLKATAEEIRGIIGLVARFKQWNDNASTAADTVQADYATRGDNPASNAVYRAIGSFAGASAYISTPLSVDGSSQYKDWVDNEYSSGAQYLKDQDTLKGVGNNLQFDITLNIDPVTIGQLDVKAQADALANSFKEQVGALFEQASVNFPIKQ